jgi:predicted AAA+ superfamily ATPase
VARSEQASFEWRRGFVQTFVERDLPQLGVNVSSATMRRGNARPLPWSGVEWLGVCPFVRYRRPTVRGYLDRLTSVLVVRQLAPWHESITKRQVRSPKVYVWDSGLLHTLLNLRTAADLEAHPKAGASWEGFVIDQLIRRLGIEANECFFWATHAGAEIDLLVVRGKTRLGFEIKRTAAPAMTRSAHIAIQDLKLQRLDIIHAADHTFPLGTHVRAVAISRLLDDIQPLG